MSALAVVNPRSAGGRTRRDWPKIAHGLSEIYPGIRGALTDKRGDATAIVRQALKDGHREIVAVGGDGTINEAINGFFEMGIPIASDAVFGFVTSGTGGDFRKSFGIGAGSEAGLAHLRQARPRLIDVGRVTCVTEGGGTAVRHFINIASAGLSGEIVAAVNRAWLSKLAGGRFAFSLHSLLALLRHRGRIVRLRIDREFDEQTRLMTVAVANGRYFGGGMHVAPNAKQDDGMFDVIVMQAVPSRRAIADMGQIYTGAHLQNPAVRALRGTKIVAAPVAETGSKPVLIEVDGENAGQLPATFEILPRALLVRA